ncbi:MAG TPA: hypothetical protein PLM14_05295 [Candidatus Hydrogenedentes bacterium]|nr:hypothetical protein [Candidatus Hydrogenedentota bacterium]HQH51926.1 hypothetical protein [Candidatus Hydrogenedentota bacterium]
MMSVRYVIGGLQFVCAAFLLTILLGCLAAGADAVAAPVDNDAPLQLDSAVVVTPADASRPEQKAVEMLLDEVEKRTTLRWKVVHEWPAGAEPVIAVGTPASLSACAAPVADDISASTPESPEGYVLRVIPGRTPTVVLVAGHDPRGVLFGVGRLLRELRMSRGSASLSPATAINTAPVCGLRGHQLGFRPKVNTYDAWNLPMWEQYYRDLAVFGTNAVELMPPKTDDAPDSPHFPLPQIEMMARLSQLADDYGLSVWIWYPAMAKDYSDPATVAQELEEWGSVFEKLPRIDAVFVPGGDPGHTQPKYMVALLEKQIEVLHRTHPNAQIWMSPQGFTKEWMDEWLEIMRSQKPAWLSGVVFGPQNRLSLSELRETLPAQYPIRHYPDITHSYCCQYPVQDWDTAYKLTQDREVINPRPRDFARIFRWSLPYTNGFITYSEGVNDDVNKMLWSALGWDPDANVYDILRQYARYFVGIDLEHDFAQALLALEQNWQGPLLTNTGVMTTLRQVQDMERSVTPQTLLNWRFQQVLYRAYYDAYVRRRLIYETELEERAMDVLRRAKDIGSQLALDEAEAILDRAPLEQVGLDLRGRVSDMAEALYQSIHMQLSVPRYKAISVGRGANFDLIDRPLNNRLWLKPRFAELRQLESEQERINGIQAILDWTNPGPGGFYDELGNPLQQPHLVRDLTTDFDPENRVNPLLGYEDEPADRRMSWFCDAETRFEAPLVMRYEDLDPNAEYKVRAVYAGDKFDTELRLLADDTIEVHPFIAKQVPIGPVEFDIPKEATADGALTLTWCQTPGRGSAGRGCQIAEVWLIKKPPEAAKSGK